MKPTSSPPSIASDHAEEVTRTVSGKLGMLASVENSHWGWDKHHLRQLYFAYMRSKMDYSGPGWQPWLSPTSVAVLERTQNKALRIITGQLKSSPVEALRLESTIIGYETHMLRDICYETHKSREKAMRLPANHPRHVALSNAVPPRNKRQSWASKGKMLEDLLPPEASDLLPTRIQGTSMGAQPPPPHQPPSRRYQQ